MFYFIFYRYFWKMENLIINDVRGVINVFNIVVDDVMEVVKKMYWVISLIFGIIFVIVGIVGNIFFVLIWSWKLMRIFIGVYLIV